MMVQITQPKGMVSQETNKEAIARVFGLKKRQVGYLSTSVAVDSYTILYEEETQTYWYRGSASGTPTSWAITDNSLSLITTAGTYVLSPGYSGDTLRSDLVSSDGLKLLGQCSDLNSLRNMEPELSGQQIYLAARVSGWAATASGMPWGGGKFRYIPNLPSSLQIDDGGSIIKTSGGKYWVREELLSGLGEIRVEWYLNSAPSFTDDASEAFQDAADTAKLWAQYSGRNSTVRLVMPPRMYITKTINVYSRGVRIDGNHGYCQVSSSGEYTSYSTLSTNSYITTSPDGGATVRAVINLTHGAGGPGVANPAYSEQELVKDWNLTLGVAGAGYNVLPLADNGITAFCHWGTSTVAASQFSFRNVSTQGFGVGYINGDNTWGGNFYECKWVGCYIPMWLINGADNAERYTLFGCVMQNGYRCVYSPWGGGR